MENKLTPEIIEKAKAAKSAEEILALAKENSIEMTAEDAASLYGQINKSGELSDDELDNVAGGGCGKNQKASLFQTGDRVRFTQGIHTGKCGTVSEYRDSFASGGLLALGVLKVTLDDGTQETVQINATYKFQFLPYDFGVERI